MTIRHAVSRAWGAMSGTTRLVLVGTVAAVAFGLVGEAQRPATQKDQSTPLANEQEAALKQKEAEAILAARTNERLRQDRAYDLTRQIKSSMRDPGSVQWHAVVANIDGSVLCVDYGGRNGFGGVTRDQVVIIDYKINESEAAWNTHCTKPPLFDVKSFAP